MLFKRRAKAAMRLRKDGCRVGGIAVQIRFVRLEHRFQPDPGFAPLDDAPAFLRLPGEQIA
ncbi:hypothetical protein [Lysobacter sp. CA199]|uniref:hypothetical protein n=1 Tax=Lysobacter sp. CA199 TaxID=3455608 RepID=UPI003F8D3F21